MSPSPSPTGTGFFIRRDYDIEMHRGLTMENTEGRWPSPGERPQEKPVLSTPWSWTSSLQDCEDKSPLSKGPRVWFVMAALADWYTGLFHSTGIPGFQVSRCLSKTCPPHTHNVPLAKVSHTVSWAECLCPSKIQMLTPETPTL